MWPDGNKSWRKQLKTSREALLSWRWIRSHSHMPRSVVTCVIKHWNNFKRISNLDSLCWFSQRRSRTPHFFWGVRTQGAMTTKLEMSRHFCTVHLAYPSSFIILCLHVLKLSCWQANKHTNRGRWKHSTLFATLRRRVIIYFSCNHGLTNGSSDNFLKRNIKRAIVMPTRDAPIV